MKNRFIVLFLLSIALLVPLSAAPTEGGAGQGETGGGTPWVPIFSAVQEKAFTIRAYKNTSAAVQLNVYDALTTKLEQVKEGQEIDLYPHIGKFLDAGWSSPINTDKNKVLFSYLVIGNSVGTYELEFTFSSFKRDPIMSNGVNYINSQYDIFSSNNRFKSGSDTTADKCTISKSSIKKNLTPDQQTLVTADDKGCSMIVSWTVTNPSGADIASELWTAEGVVVMALDKTAYDDAVTGDFHSTVRIELRSVL